MSNPEFKVIFTETDRNTADNARQYYEGKHKKYEEILNVADYICLISALFCKHHSLQSSAQPSCFRISE